MPEGVAGRVEWMNGDILDPYSVEEGMRDADAVIHAAAKVSFLDSERKAMFQANVEGTANVVNTAIERNIPRMVYVSSVAALGRRKEGERVDEKSQWIDNSLNSQYGISKHLAEMEVWRAIAEGLNAVIVNPATILGFGDWNQSSSAIFRSVYEGYPWYTHGINGFVDVEDVASIIVRLMESSIHSERFILSGETLCFSDLFRLIAEAFGKKPPYLEATPFLAAIAWRVEKLKSLFSKHPPLITRESARIALSKTVFDNGKILEALPGYRFNPIKNTVYKACQSYMKEMLNKAG
jgi:nucleoside-diphosphate-sugar epimerase